MRNFHHRVAHDNVIIIDFGNDHVDSCSLIGKAWDIDTRKPLRPEYSTAQKWDAEYKEQLAIRDFRREALYRAYQTRVIEGLNALFENPTDYPMSRMSSSEQQTCEKALAFLFDCYSKGNSCNKVGAFFYANMNTGNSLLLLPAVHFDYEGYQIPGIELDRQFL